MTSEAPLRGFLLLMLAVVMTPVTAFGEVALPQTFGDHMVLQRGVAIPIWGSATPGATVAVTLGNRNAEARADDSGRWRVELAPMPAGGPYELTVTSGSAALVLRDVLLGDVWVCSGQSNMEWTVADSMDAPNEISSAGDNGIRHFEVPRSWSREPESGLAEGDWQTTNPENVGSFSAVAYFFARELRRHQLRSHRDVPIGLINSSWGGSRIEPWLSARSLGLDASRLDSIFAAEEAYSREILRRIHAEVGELPTSDAGLVDGKAVWADPELDDSDWREIDPKMIWEAQGLDGMDGVVWYRSTFELTDDEAAAGVRLGLGPIDDSDTTWVNGIEVGATELAWNVPRVYEVPPTALRSGRNVVAVRVEDTGGGGGLYGKAELRFVEPGIWPATQRFLAGPWRCRVGAATVEADARMNQVPTALYNAMIHPLLETPVAGFIWYQGESNANPDDAFRYRELFVTLIREWRAEWGRDDLPFLWVQLANFRAAPDDTEDSGWAMLRESQSAALRLAKTAQIVAIDIGNADDIHPRNKQEVGRRLALAARRIAHGEKIVASGPVYRAHTFAENKVTILFDHAENGLVARGNESGFVGGFSIAGADRSFVDADAVVNGDRVVVWSEQVPEPAAVRYGWADNPEGVNLYNWDGLPASPFRTDTW